MFVRLDLVAVYIHRLRFRFLFLRASVRDCQEGNRRRYQQMGIETGGIFLESKTCFHRSKTNCFD